MLQPVNLLMSIGKWIDCPTLGVSSRRKTNRSRHVDVQDPIPEGAQSARISFALWHQRSVPGRVGPASLATWLLLSTVWPWGWIPTSHSSRRPMCPLQEADIVDRQHLVSEHQVELIPVVSGPVSDQSDQDRSVRPGAVSPSGRATEHRLAGATQGHESHGVAGSRAPPWTLC